MEIAFLIPGRLEPLTGGSLYNRFLAEALARRGHRLRLYPVPLRPRLRLWLENVRPATWRRCSPERGAVVIVDGLIHEGLLLPLRIGRRSGGARIALLHQLTPASPEGEAGRRFRERIFLGGMSGVLCPGEILAAEITRRTRGRLPVHPASPGGDRLGRAPNEAFILRRARTPGPLELLFVGNLSPVKGLPALLSALAGLPPPLWRLTVVGSLSFDPAAARAAQQTADRFGLGERVRFRGALNGAELARCYETAQVFAMPYARESFGIAALEAMAFGLPVIGSAAGGVREFVRHGENGFLIPPGDLAGCRRAVAILAQDRRRLADLGSQAFRDFLRRPGWRDSLAGACRFLETWATRPPGRKPGPARARGHCR